MWHVNTIWNSNFPAHKQRFIETAPCYLFTHCFCPTSCVVMIDFIWTTKPKKFTIWGQPCGVVVKFSMVCFSGLGSWVWILGADLHHSSAMLWWWPACKIQEDWHGCKLRANLPQGKREEDWQQMLAQS